MLRRLNAMINAVLNSIQGTVIDPIFDARIARLEEQYRQLWDERRMKWREIEKDLGDLGRDVSNGFTSQMLVGAECIGNKAALVKQIDAELDRIQEKLGYYPTLQNV
jgi:hypothetical protein